MATVNVITGTARSGRGAVVNRLFVGAAGGALLLLPSRGDVRRRQESLLFAQGPAGFWGAPILDLASFAERIVTESLGVVQKVSRVERRLLVERAVRDVALELTRHLGVDPSGLPGFSGHVLSLLTQLKQGGIEPQEFLDRLRAKGTLQPADEAVAAVYARYQELLKDSNLYDVPGLYWAAEAVCMGRRPGVLQGVRLLLLDGFDDFTPSELRLLKVVEPHVEQMTIGLHHDADASRLDAYVASDEGLRRIRNVFDVTLSEADAPPPDTEPAFVSQHLFWRDVLPELPALPPGVSIVSCIDARHEAESTARAVRSLLDTGTPPGRIAVAVRDTGAALPVLLSALRERGVPHRCSLRVPLTATAPGQALFGFLAAIDAWEREAVLDVLTSPLVWPDTDAATRDAFSLLVRKALILRGQRTWERQLTSLAVALESGKGFRAEALLARLDKPASVLENLQGRIKTLADWAKLFPANAKDSNYLEATWKLLAGWFVSGGDHKEATSALWLALDSLGKQGCTGRTISRADWQALLLRVLAEADVPLSTGRSGVTVSAPDALRNQGFAHVFVLGVNEGDYPRPPALNALYGKQDHARLCAAGVPIETGASVAARERLAFLRLFLEAGESVTLSWRLQKEQGREASASPFLAEVAEVLGNRPGVRSPAPPASAIVAKENLGSARDVANAAMRGGSVGEAALFKRQPPLGRALGVEQERWREAPYGSHDGMVAAAEACHALAERYGAEHVYSAAQFENWLGCPFQFFQDRVLKIDESTPFEGEIDPRARGSLLHAILHRLHGRHVGRSLDTVPEAEGFVWLAEEVSKEFARAPRALAGVPEEAVAAEQAYAGGLLRRYLRTAYRIDADTWAPAHFELAFGNADDPDAESDEAPTEQFPVFPLELQDGSTVFLRGRMDRVDFNADGSAARVIDYKSGSAPGAAEIYTGRKLQLTVYAWALRRVLFKESPCTEAVYIPVGKPKWRDALGNAPRQKKAEWAEREANTQEAIRRAVAGIASGCFPPVPAGKTCYGCGSARACRRQESRQMRKVNPDLVLAQSLSQEEEIFE